MAKKKTVKKRAARAKRARVKRATVKARTKPVAFYKQPVVALSNGFERVFKTLF